MSKIIGLTGGIGSGKTTIASFFESEGIPIYLSDLEAKKIMNKPETIQLVKQVFGNEIIKDNLINRSLLAEIVFNAPKKLTDLNNIIHPLVKEDFENWVKEKMAHPFLVKESAILFESGSYKFCDIIISVIASEETRIQRVMQRDNCTREDVIARIKNQWSDQERKKNSDYIILNEDLINAKIEFNKILKKIKKIH
jgi:dephospho-CoA kinase